jgi:hypothetical protein
MPVRRTAALAVSTAALLLTLAACHSATGTAPASGTAGSDAGSSATATAGPTLTAPTTATAPAPTTAAATPTATAGAVTAVFSGLGGHPVLTPGGPALDFSVTVHNGTGQALRDIQPLISMGHCSCSSGGAAMMPAGTLELRNPATGDWQRISYDAEGTGMDFSYVDQISGVALAAGASETFGYRVALLAGTPVAGAPPLRNGSGTVNVDVQQLPAHTDLAPGVAATVWVTTG